MLFNSIDFAIFFPIVFTLYWFVVNRNLKMQNLLIVISSYIFYGWWSWIFLTLIFYSTVIDFSVGMALSKEENITKRKVLLWTSIFFNLGFLAVFKYYNFFIESFTSVFSLFGAEINPNTLDIIIPVGISFYTFQTLSYTIDSYHKKIVPAKDFVAFSAYVSFFPQLVAGPIERASNLLPQFYKKRVFEYAKATDGLRQILWGFFKKIVIADSCAKHVDIIFNNSGQCSGGTLMLGAILFSIQIYADFSGYSDIAIGTSRLLGFNLMQNFAFPYFSRNIVEFWRRWHISLSTWFRDYLFIPLSYNVSRRLPKKSYFGIKTEYIIYIVSSLVTFTLCGLWHGARWNYIFWGFLHGTYLSIYIFIKKRKKVAKIIAENKLFTNLKNLCNILFTFLLVLVGWIFFRVSTISEGIHYVNNIFNNNEFTQSFFIPFGLILLISFFMVIEWSGRKNAFALKNTGIRWRKPFRLALYFSILFLILLFGGERQNFIYFQF